MEDQAGLGHRGGGGPHDQPDVERFGYKRAGIQHVIELDGPHLLMQTHPAEVAKVITDAAAEQS